MKNPSQPSNQTMLLLILLINICTKNVIATEFYKVNINGSIIIGRKLYTDFESVGYVAYWKIPYAEPPRNDLRFKPPKLRNVILNSGIHDYSNNDLEACSLPADDCLYLSIFFPLPEKPDISESLPVMVWLHEQCNCHEPDFLLEENILVVAVSFRVGINGFLNTGDEFAVGNMGAKDVVAALTWVRSNIIFFNGNPNRITVYGSGPDAADIASSLLLSYSAGNLFARVIAGSGSALSPKHYRNNDDEIARKLFQKHIGISEYFDRTSLYKLLMVTPLDELNENSPPLFDSSDVRDRQCMIKPFGLTIEKMEYNKSFINMSPIEIYEKNLHNINLDVMMGYLDLEAMYKLKTFLRKKDTMNYLNNNFQYLLPFEGVSTVYGSKTYKCIQKKIKNFYFLNGTITERSIRRFGKYLSDQVIYPIIRQAKIHAELTSRNVYLYRFSYNGAFNINWRNSVQNLTKAGATTGDEICYIFKCKCADKLYKEKRDLLFIKRFVKLWTNFVKFGDPTPQLSSSTSIIGNIQWTPLRSKKDSLVFSISENLRMIKSPEFKRMEFWDKLRTEVSSPERNIVKHDEL